MRTRVPLYDRLPEIYRIRDEEQLPPGQLKAYLSAVETAFSAIHENIETLYHDLFIDTCQDWVIPYIADLVGTSHLKGDPRTLRADVADTIALRRRKGTLIAIERLAANLTGWAARAVELRENLGWNQHLNHTRPDFGGRSFYGELRPEVDRFLMRRGGTVPLRDPAMLSLLNTPFDQSAHTVDVKPPAGNAVHYNLPNLAIFLWRLNAYRLRVIRPLFKGVDTFPPGPEAQFVIRIDLHQLDRAVRLFNTWRNDPWADPPRLTAVDEVPGAIPPARLTSNSHAGNPGDYIGIDTFDETIPLATGDLNLTDDGIQLFLPNTQFSGVNWTFRGDNLCAWAAGLKRPVAVHEIVIDPVIGRMAIGVGTTAERDALTPATADGFSTALYAGYTYGAVGDIGAHPVSREAAPTTFNGVPVVLRTVQTLTGTSTLANALANLDTVAGPTVIEIADSLVHDLDPSTIAGTSTAIDGAAALEFGSSVIIRAAGGHRPVIRLAQPLRIRPANAAAPSNRTQVLRLEGLYITRGPGFPAGQALISRAAIARLELIDCTLDPGGFALRIGTRSPVLPSIQLGTSYGFSNAADEAAFDEITPGLLLQRTICGAVHAENERYTLELDQCIIDAGRGVADPTDSVMAIAGSGGSDTSWGPALRVREVTVFGRVRVGSATGSGAIFVHRLEALNNQIGCLKYSYFRGDADRLPQNHACVTGASARLAFTSEWFESPGYAQLSRASDSRILTRGPGDDQMGAFGSLNKEAHKWINLSVRLREFMPLGVRPLVIAVT